MGLKLVERAQQQEVASKVRPRRQVKRRDTEQQVERAIAQHLPSATTQTDHVIVEGKSLRTRLMEDKRASRKDGRKLGPLYWQHIKKSYAWSPRRRASS